MNISRRRRDEDLINQGERGGDGVAEKRRPKQGKARYPAQKGGF